jgi:MFS family permease
VLDMIHRGDAGTDDGSRHADAGPASGGRRRTRARRVLLGRPPTTGAAIVHALNSFAEACFTVSLAGSLFLSISFDAARPRILIYLVCTLAPFVLVAPLLGPLVDRIRGGHRAMVIVTMLGRAVISLLMAWLLRDLLVFPLAFGILVLAKTYSVTRNALIPRLVPGEELVEVNSRLAVLGTLSSGIGGACAAGLLTLTSARAVPLLGAAIYGLGALAALRLPAATSRVVEPDTEIVWSELHARTILAAQSSMLALKGVAGFLLFLLGANLKRSGAPTWFFGLVFVASGAGSFAGNTIAPVLRARFTEAQMLAGAVAAGAGISGVAAIAANRTGTVLAAVGIGLVAAVAHQAFNAAVQQHAPDVDRGRTLAAFDTRFQLAWVIGALVAVAARPSLQVGFALLTAVLLADAIDLLLRRSHDPIEEQPNHETLAQLALSARGLATLGQYRAAMMVVTAAADLVEWPPGNDAVDRRADLEAACASAIANEPVAREDFVRSARAIGWQFDD